MRDRLLMAIRPWCFICLSSAFVATSCSGVAPSKEDSAASAPSTGEDQNADERVSTGRLQIQVMDFADIYSSSIAAALDRYIREEPDPAKRVAAQHWKVRYSAASTAIAASRDPRTNLLDMMVFIAAGKRAVDSYWVPKVFGKKASALSDVYKELDQQIRGIAGSVLTLQQQEDLRRLVANWARENSGAHDVVDIRLRNLDGVRLDAFDDGKAARGIMAGLRRFLGKVDTSLLYGERVMFCLERTPRILTQQTELTLAQIGEAFPIATVKPDALASGIKDLPAMLQAGIDRNEGSLNALLPQIAGTLESANTLAHSLDTSLAAIQELTKKTEESGLLKSDPAPLLRDATVALTRLESSVVGLNRILDKTADSELRVAAISRQIDEQSVRLMDAAFQRIMVLLSVFFGGLFLILLAARILFVRRGTPSGSKQG